MISKTIGYNGVHDIFRHTHLAYLISQPLVIGSPALSLENMGENTQKTLVIGDSLLIKI